MTRSRDGHPQPSSGPNRGSGGRNPGRRPDACSEEMRSRTAIDAQAELLVRGEAPAGGDPGLVELAALARELRGAYAHPPTATVRERQLAAIAAEARRLGVGSAVAASRGRDRIATRRPPTRRGPLAAFRLAAIGLAALGATAGLAAAGVRPPAPIDSVLERVGLGFGAEDADHGDSAPAPARDGAGAPGATPGDRGASRGQGSERRRAGERGDPPPRSAPGGQRSETGAVNSGPGQATAGEARTGGAPPQSPGRSGEHAPDGAGPPPAPPSQSPPAPPNQGSPATGKPDSPGNSPFGQEHAPDGVGGPPGQQ